jgi:glycogen debranching enzyme
MAPVAPWRRGWGVRTLDARVARYNPMSHQNGSVWPHDNASAVPLFLLPELFCDFSRREEEGPTFYPVACSPQAWAKRRPICSFIAASMTWVCW